MKSEAVNGVTLYVPIVNHLGCFTGKVWEVALITLCKERRGFAAMTSRFDRFSWRQLRLSLAPRSLPPPRPSLLRRV